MGLCPNILRRLRGRPLRARQPRLHDRRSQPPLEQLGQRRIRILTRRTSNRPPVRRSMWNDTEQKTLRGIITTTAS